MEKLIRVPFHGRLGFKILLFNALLLFCIIAPARIILEADYKDLMDRISFHTELFLDCADRLGRIPARDWPDAIGTFPKVFYGQRICVFGLDRSLAYDSGVMRDAGEAYPLTLIFPDPYIDWSDPGVRFDPGAYVRNLLAIDTDGIDPERLHQWTRNVRYEGGLDRIILSGMAIRSTDGERRVLTMSHSLTDILIQGRAMKERFLILYATVVLLGVLLTVLLARSVTIPLKRLYAWSNRIVARQSGDDAEPLPDRGEIGGICAALRCLIERQKRQSENFRRFSSDIVHELKTPLSAIRSGLEVYAESADGREKAEVYDRIHTVIRRMENLMNEIERLGTLETSHGAEYSNSIVEAVGEVDAEFADAGLRIEIPPHARELRIPLSSDKIYQILANLVKNAVSFSPEHGSVTLTADEDDGFLVIRVRDRGPGIPGEAMAHITERFYSYRPGDGEKHSGLGLAIAQTIAVSCGGSLDYRNPPGGGAEFICRFPVA